jgi:hypothetical protein
MSFHDRIIANDARNLACYGVLLCFVALGEGILT